jgi:ATP-dependent helicase HrpB
VFTTLILFPAAAVAAAGLVLAVGGEAAVQRWGGEDADVMTGRVGYLFVMIVVFATAAVTRAAVITRLKATTMAILEEPWLKELFGDDYYEARGVLYDEQAKRVVARKEKRFRDLVLEDKGNSEDVPMNEAAALLTKEVLAGRIVIEAWDESVEQWIVRVNRLAEWFPELEVNVLTDADRGTLIEQICFGETSARAVKEKAVMPVLRDWLTAEQLAVIDDYLPEKLTMGNGRKAKLTYHKEGPPIMSARIQELFGVEGKFTIGHGRVPVKFEVLAPNHRAIQVTDDLTSFWRDMYPKVKAELSRRYPRHEWR